MRVRIRAGGERAVVGLHAEREVKEERGELRGEVCVQRW